MEDQGIIALFFDRSEQAIEETDKKYGGYCYSIAYNILSNREDSEESVSDTYLAAWNTIPPRRPNFLNAFLAKMTRHISIDRWRKLSAKKRGGGEIILALDELEECVDSHNVESRMDEIKEDSLWVRCPECHAKTRVKVYSETVLIKFPLFCPKCKHETLIDVVKLKMVTSK